MRFLIDGMNVIGARPDGWWRDRRRAQEVLVSQLVRWAATGQADQVTVVFDGAAPDQPPVVDTGPGTDQPPVAADAEPRVQVCYAPGGPGAADDVVACLVAADGDPATLTVVTSDADLGRRVVASGATVEGAGRFRARLR